MMLVDVLLILSQLARIPDGVLPAAEAGRLLDDLGSLLEHANANVRSKACNLLGNMCRHSNFFYGDLLGDGGLVDSLVSRCEDEDSIRASLLALLLATDPFTLISSTHPFGRLFYSRPLAE